MKNICHPRYVFGWHSMNMPKAIPMFRRPSSGQPVVCTTRSNAGNLSNPTCCLTFSFLVGNMASTRHDPTGQGSDVMAPSPHRYFTSSTISCDSMGWIHWIRTIKPSKRTACTQRKSGSRCLPLPSGRVWQHHGNGMQGIIPSSLNP